MFYDIVAEYLIDVKQYTRADYQAAHAKTLLVGPISDTMKTYLKETLQPSLELQCQEAKEEFSRNLDLYRENYRQDHNYPIYLQSLRAKEKFQRTSSHLQQALETLEWIVKEKTKAE